VQEHGLLPYAWPNRSSLAHDIALQFPIRNSRDVLRPGDCPAQCGWEQSRVLIAGHAAEVSHVSEGKLDRRRDLNER
jgi:hypothetical protein